MHKGEDSGHEFVNLERFFAHKLQEKDYNPTIVSIMTSSSINTTLKNTKTLGFLERLLANDLF